MRYTWTPVLPPPPEGGSFSVELADLLTRHLFDGPGEYVVARSQLNGFELDEQVVNWLKGVRDATSDEEVRADAYRLLSAIAEHGVISLSVER